MSRDFLNQNLGDLVPTEALRAKKVSLLLTRLDEPHKLSLFAEQVMSRTNNLNKATNVLARLAKASITHNSNNIRAPLTSSDITFASKILFASSMEPTSAAKDRGELTTLRMFFTGGIWYLQGRVGRALQKLLGNDRLPVLMPGTRLAKLIM